MNINYFFNGHAALPYFFTPVLILLIAWSLFWKGWALWAAARNAQKGWFAALLLINTVGILEILYLFVFSKSKSLAETPKMQQL